MSERNINISHKMSEIHLMENGKQESIPLPMKHKAKILIWNDLSSEQVENLMKFQKIPQIKVFLAEVFDLQNYKTNLKQQIELDLYVHAVKFAQDQRFNPQQLSTFVSIIRQVHKTSIETPFGNLEEVFQYFKDLLLCHSVNRPPYSSELFTVDEVHFISQYVINTYIRHFKMYKYVFTSQVKLNLVIKYIGEPEIIQSQEIEPISETVLGEEKLETSELSHFEEQETIEEKENPAKTCLKNLIMDVLQDEIQMLLHSFSTQSSGTEEVPKRKEENTKKGSKK